MTIGEKIREYRESVGCSQMELSKGTGIRQGNISRWESGTHIPNVADCIKIADFLKISLDELLGRADYATGNIVLAGEQVSTFEKKLLDYLRKLPMDDQYQVLGFIQALAL